MLTVNVIGDETLQSVLDSLISGMLPHENYDPAFFGSILSSTLDYVAFEEMQMEYYAFFYVLKEMRLMQASSRDFKPMLTKDRLVAALEPNLYTLALERNLGMKKFNEMNNHSTDLSNELELQNSVNRLYARIEDLYDRAFELALPSEEALSVIPALKESVAANIAETAVGTQAIIQDVGIRLGKKFYIGPSGWIEFIQDTAIELKERFQDRKSKAFRLDDLESLNEINTELELLFDPLAYWDMPPLDASAPMLKHWLLVIAANENVGKTALMVHIAAKLLSEGKSVVYMHGEAKKSAIYARILSAYIHTTTGLWITTHDIASQAELDPEDQRLIQVKSLELMESGLLTFVSALDYYQFYNQCKDMYDEEPFDCLLVDHSGTLTGSKKLYDDIGSLAVQGRDFKNDYPVFLVISSHLSSMAKDLISKGKTIDTSPTKGNSTLSGEADEVFVLFRNEKMKKLNLTANMVTKTRGKEAVKDIVMMSFKPEINRFDFDPTAQTAFSGVEVEADAMLERLAGENEEDEDEFGSWSSV